MSAAGRRALAAKAASTGLVSPNMAVADGGEGVPHPNHACPVITCLSSPDMPVLDCRIEVMHSKVGPACKEYSTSMLSTREAALAGIRYYRLEQYPEAFPDLRRQRTRAVALTSSLLMALGLRLLFLGCKRGPFDHPVHCPSHHSSGLRKDGRRRHFGGEAHGHGHSRCPGAATMICPSYNCSLRLVLSANKNHSRVLLD